MTTAAEALATGPAGYIADRFRPQFHDTRTGAAAGSVLALLESGTPADLDRGALNVFLRTGLFLGGTTPFLHIRAPCPPVPVLAPADLTRDQALAGYIDLFRQAMARLLDRHDGEPFALGLSGGRDSRHILLQAVDQGRRPAFCWTVANPALPEDTAVAAALAERCGVRRVLVQPADGLAAELEKNRRTDFCSRQHRWMVGALPALRGIGHLYDGIGGDVLSESSVLKPEWVALMAADRLDELAEALVPPGPLPLVADPGLFPDRADAVHRVAEELARHRPAVNPLASFFFWNRTRRDIGESPFALLAEGGRHVHAPFLDDDLFAFLASLPARLTLKTGLHTEAIRRAFPAFADIPYAAKAAAPRPPSALAVLRLAAGLAARPPGLADRRGAVARLLRAAAVPARRDDTGWILTTAAYLSQIARPLAR